MTQAVSRNGGDFPVWAKTGEQLFYHRALPGEADEFVSVTVNPDGSISPPVVVFAGDFASGRAASISLPTDRC